MENNTHPVTRRLFEALKFVEIFEKKLVELLIKINSRKNIDAPGQLFIIVKKNNHFELFHKYKNNELDLYFPVSRKGMLKAIENLINGYEPDGRAMNQHEEPTTTIHGANLRPLVNRQQRRTQAPGFVQG